MNEELLKLQQAAEAFLELRGKVEKVVKTILAKQEQLDLLKIQLDAREDGLLVREAEVKKIEDIIALKEEAQKLIAEAKADTEALEEKQRNFNANAEKTQKDLQAQAEKNTLDRQANEREAKVLNERDAALKKEKEEYKIKLAKGIVDRAEKL